MSEAFRNWMMNNEVTLTPTQGDTVVGSPLYTEDAHGFPVGTVVRRLSAIAHTEAQADSAANIGIGLSLIIHVESSSQFVALKAGSSHAVTLTAHGFGAFGTTLWLSQATAGLITATEPASGRKVYLGFVIDANTICWEPGLRAYEV